MKKTKVVLNILSVVSFIFGAVYCFSLVFIPVGVYCFSAGKVFSSKADHMLNNYSVDKKILTRYFIFVSIACFPIGLLSILAYYFLYGNNVKVDNFNYVKITDVQPEEKQADIAKETQSEDEVESAVKVEENVESSEKVQEETEEEKLEKLKKLAKFKDKGIISEEEYEMAREQMFGKRNEQ